MICGTPIHHWGGTGWCGLGVTRTAQWAVIKSTRFRGLNVVICKIVIRRIRTPLFGLYLSPLTLDHLPGLEEALQCFKGLEPIVFGDLNMDLDNVHSLRIQSVADLLTDFGLIDLVRHVHKRPRFCYLKTWKKILQGILLNLICNYIPGTYWRCFELVRIRYMGNYMSDHLELLALTCNVQPSATPTTSGDGNHSLSHFPLLRNLAGSIPLNLSGLGTWGTTCLTTLSYWH